MQIYLLDINSISDTVFYEYYSRCPEYRKKKIDSKLSFQDKLRSLAGEILLMQGLSRLGIKNYDVAISKTGKPFLRGLSLFFSISHSENIASCALGTHELGIDIECRKTVSNSVTSRFFSDVEKGETDIKVWTRKEALAKASGLGLCRDVLRTDVSRDKASFLDNTYFLKTLKPEGYVLSVCSLSPISDITIEHIDAKTGSL